MLKTITLLPTPLHSLLLPYFQLHFSCTPSLLLRFPIRHFINFTSSSSHVFPPPIFKKTFYFRFKTQRAFLNSSSFSLKPLNSLLLSSRFRSPLSLFSLNQIRLALYAKNMLKSYYTVCQLLTFGTQAILSQ